MNVTILCAWCGHTLRSEEWPGDATSEVTHSICDACSHYWFPEESASGTGTTQ